MKIKYVFSILAMFLFAWSAPSKAIVEDEDIYWEKGYPQGWRENPNVSRTPYASRAEACEAAKSLSPTHDVLEKSPCVCWAGGDYFTPSDLKVPWGCTVYVKYRNGFDFHESEPTSFFKYHGLDLNKTAQEIRQMYLHSYFSHPAAGVVSISVRPEDFKHGITKVGLEERKDYWPQYGRDFSKQLPPSNIQLLRLWFGKDGELFKIKPRDLKNEHELRYPPCNSILDELVRTYGKPLNVEEGQEESTINTGYQWNSHQEEMILSCVRWEGEDVARAVVIDISRRKK